MEKLKLYLDNCCYNRPFDDQSQQKIHLETEAKLFIQTDIRSKKYSMVWSYMLDIENRDNPYDERRNAIEPWKGLAAEYCPSSDEILSNGKTIMAQGIKPNDALHLSCAVKSGCDYFITTDSGILNKSIANIKIRNPVDFIKETGGLP